MLPVGAREPGPKSALYGMPHRWRDPRRSFELEVDKKSGVRHERDLKETCT